MGPDGATKGPLRRGQEERTGVRMSLSAINLRHPFKSLHVQVCTRGTCARRALFSFGQIVSKNLDLKKKKKLLFYL